MLPKELYVTAPPGRLGIVLADSLSNDCNCNTVVSFVSEESPLSGIVFCGDFFANINGVDVRGRGNSGQTMCRSCVHIQLRGILIDSFIIYLKYQFGIHPGVLEVLQQYSQEEKVITIIRHDQKNQVEDGVAEMEPTEWKEEILTAPPGRLGIGLEDSASHVSRAAVSSVALSSPLSGKLFQGDYIILVNDRCPQNGPLK